MRRTLVTAAIAVLAGVVVAAPASGQDDPATCLSLADFSLHPATVVGTSGDDVLRGTDGPDVIVGLGGDDTIWGLGGDDVICGDLGDDRIDGGGGSDSILGDTGESFLLGQGGGLNVPGGDDTLFGGAGDDGIGVRTAPTRSAPAAATTLQRDRPDRTRGRRRRR